MLDRRRDATEGLAKEQGWVLDNWGVRREEIEDLYPTTRRYPRTIEEAFPNTVERAEWFYPPDKSWGLWDYVLGGIGEIGRAHV